MNQEYLIISNQTIQTTMKQVINRIEIGVLIGESKEFYILKTDSGQRKICKHNINTAISLSDVKSIETLLTRLRGALV